MGGGCDEWGEGMGGECDEWSERMGGGCDEWSEGCDEWVFRTIDELGARKYQSHLNRQRLL